MKTPHNLTALYVMMKRFFIGLFLTCLSAPFLEGSAPPIPKVLILGDSISIGYTPFVQKALEGEAHVFRPMRSERGAENCEGTTYGVTELERWLQIDGGGWDVIHFNFGLHDLKRVHPETRKNSNHVAHPHQAEPEVYAKQLEQITKRLKSTGAHLIYGFTTPVPAGGVKPHRSTEDPWRYNELAREVMARYDVEINDLYCAALDRLEEIQLPVNVHFTRAGSEYLADKVVAAMRPHIAARQEAVTAALAARQKDARPNVVFILSDDHRSDLMGIAGHPILKTPNMDQLAKSGARFENMFVTTSICAASRATLLTGLYEKSHGFTFGTPPIAEPFCETSYPTQLRKNGYRTGFIGKFGVSTANGMREEMFDVFRPLNRAPYFKKQPDGSLRHITQIAGDYSMDFLHESVTSAEPFCLSISFNAPHAEDGDKENHFPWTKVVDGLYDDIEIPAPHLSDPSVFDSQPEFLRDSMNRDRWYWRWDTPEKYQKNVRAYFRMISGVDHVIGRVRDQLESLGLAENTVIIFSGDNGYYLGSRGFAGKWSHYEESLRVPLIIFDPRQPAERSYRVITRMALNVDIPATILELAGVEIPDRYQGRNLMGLVAGEDVGEWRNDTFVEHRFNNPRIPKWEGVRDERFVYANYYEQEPPFEFLHDLKEDPEQLKNFVDDPNYQDILRVMRERTRALAEHGGRL